jgi:hypothetical protein
MSPVFASIKSNDGAKRISCHNNAYNQIDKLVALRSLIRGSPGVSEVFSE